MAVWIFCVSGVALLQAAAGIEAGAPVARTPVARTAVTFAIGGGPFLVLGFVQLGVRNLWPAFVATLALAPAILFTPLSLLWIAMAVVMVICSLLARSEIKAARKACITL